MRRIDYLDDPNAPQINRIVPSASTITLNSEGKILLQRRRDTGFWALPGGAMEIGETIGDTAIRETKEETGFDVELKYLVGIYTNPRHVVEFSNGEVRQQFSVCFACRIVGGELQVSHESTEVGFFSPQEIEHLNMHPSIRLRIQHFLEYRKQPYIG
ncbi:MAG TPA: NUDIX domain-containing protein [Ktedonobacteraceae bacterium]|nr:NUDIX domain-containing protein [Ktedonobacteraceae bacterium]